MERRDFLKGLAAASGAISAPALYGAQANRPAPQLLAQDNGSSPGRPTIRGQARKRILAIADPQEWYASPGYHHDSASHTLATIERLGRESGAWITVIRTDMHLLTKQPDRRLQRKKPEPLRCRVLYGRGPLEHHRSAESRSAVVRARRWQGFHRWTRGQWRASSFVA